MKKTIALILSLVMILAAFPVISAYADEVPALTYTEHLTNNSDVGYEYDVTNASIAWVKQAKGALIWVAVDDGRSDAEIIAQAKAEDASLTHGTDDFAVMRGVGSAETPNKTGSPAIVTVADFGTQKVLSIEGKYSHFVGGYFGPTEAADPEEPEVPEVIDEEPTEPETAEGDVKEVRIDVPRKMAVAFADGTVCYGGETKEFVTGQEYTFQMCSVNWENGVYDQSGNGICGTVVYRMTVVHQDKFLRLAAEAKQNPEKYTIKGIDIIDNEAKTIVVNGDAEDTHLETDVNNFFVAYRFHFANEDEDNDSDNKTGIDGVVNTPVQSLSVNLPLGSTIACKAFDGSEMVATDNVFVTVNSGTGVYDDVELTSVNDYTWAV